MSRLVKGSHAALDWGKKMRRIRAAGMRTEKKFFGKRGVFARAGHTQHLKLKPNPEPHFTSWRMLIDYLKQEGWKPKGKKGVAAFGRTIGDLSQALQLEARNWRVLSQLGSCPVNSLSTYKTLDRSLIAANRQANDYLRATQPGKNPSSSYVGIYLDETGEEQRRVKVTAQSEQEARLIMKERFGREPDSIRPPRKNPITIVGNPPKRIRSTVAGVMYNKVWEIQAEKTGDTHKGFWYHPFKSKSDVQMLALDNGDLLIHSRAGNKLWRED